MACAGPLDTAPATPLHYAPYRAPDSPQRTPRPMSPPRFVNIGPYSFAVTPGYSTGAEGFVVGEAELEVLDTARAERVRKKGFKVLEKLRVKSGRRTLSEGELRHLTSTVAEFDREVRLERTPDPRGLSEDDRVRQRPPRLATPSVEPELGGGEFDAEVIRLAELRVAPEEWPWPPKSARRPWPPFAKTPSSAKLRGPESKLHSRSVRRCNWTYSSSAKPLLRKILHPPPSTHSVPGKEPLPC